MTTITTPDLPPSSLVIFGITGDLADRKLLPALYYLAQHSLLPEHLKIIGITRRGTTVEEVIDKTRESVVERGEKPQEDVLQALAKLIEIIKMDLLSSDDYVKLGERLNQIEDESGVCMDRLFYLAIPAQAYNPVIKQLGDDKLNQSCQHGSGNSRLLIEKPFGYDLSSAEELVGLIHKYFSEKQVYRIDHYMAKETAQNILAFRFRNPIFKKLWDHNSISRIMITAAEKIDIEDRVAFYEQTGALRDFVQSHMLQLLALTTMEEPSKLDSEAIHQQKLTLLNSITPIAANKVESETVRAQYEGYKEAVDNPDSFTETYVAMRLNIVNNRWKDTPILLRTGKALKERAMEITLFFTDNHSKQMSNIFTFRIQPNEGIGLTLVAKKPGFENQLANVHMEFSYDRSFGKTNGHPDAYERVLVDAFRADQTLFATSEEVLASWRILENVTSEWSKNGDNLVNYARGSWGPAEAESLAEQSGGNWPEHFEDDF